MKLMNNPCFLATMATLALAAPLEPRDTYPCVNGVFILAARGTDGGFKHPQKTNPAYAKIGALEDIAQEVIDAAGENSYLRALPYAAAGGAGITGYYQSMAHGVDVGQAIIKSYVHRCKLLRKNPRIILMGYSQGAQVMTSVLSGALLQPNLDAYKQYITAGTFFASPSFRAGYVIDGPSNSTKDGTLLGPPKDYDYFGSTYHDKVQNYCAAGDKFCASGKGDDALTIHVNEVGIWRSDAVKYLKERV